MSWQQRLRLIVASVTCNLKCSGNEKKRKRLHKIACMGKEEMSENLLEVRKTPHSVRHPHISCRRKGHARFTEPSLKDTEVSFQFKIDIMASTCFLNSFRPSITATSKKTRVVSVSPFSYCSTECFPPFHVTDAL